MTLVLPSLWTCAQFFSNTVCGLNATYVSIFYIVSKLEEPFDVNLQEKKLFRADLCFP